MLTQASTILPLVTQSISLHFLVGWESFTDISIKMALHIKIYRWLSAHQHIDGSDTDPGLYNPPPIHNYRKFSLHVILGWAGSPDTSI